MTEKRAIHIARHRVVQEANAHYFCPKLPTKYLEFWRMVLEALSVPGVDVETIMEAIRSVKGIGAKRLYAIRNSIEAIFEGPGENKKEG